MTNRHTPTGARRVHFLQRESEQSETYASLLDAAQRESAADKRPDMEDGDGDPPAVMCLMLQMEELRHILKCVLHSIEEDKQRIDMAEGLVKTIVGHVDRLNERVSRLELQHGGQHAPANTRACLRVPILRQ